MTDTVQVSIDTEWEILTLAHSKGQSQGHAHFDNEYFGDGDR